MSDTDRLAEIIAEAKAALGGHCDGGLALIDAITGLVAECQHQGERIAELEETKAIDFILNANQKQLERIFPKEELDQAAKDGSFAVKTALKLDAQRREIGELKAEIERLNRAIEDRWKRDKKLSKAISD